MSTTTNRPTHRLSLVIDRGERDAEFHELCGVWPTKNGAGFTFTLPFDLRRGDRIYMAEINHDRAISAPGSETVQ